MMQKLYEDGVTNQWKRETREDKGKNTIEEWINKYSARIQEERENKVRNTKSAKEYTKWKTEGRSK